MVQCSVAAFTEWSYEGKPKGCGLVGATASYRYMGAYMFVYALSAFVFTSEFGWYRRYSFSQLLSHEFGAGAFCILKKPGKLNFGRSTKKKGAVLNGFNAMAKPKYNLYKNNYPYYQN